MVSNTMISMSDASSHAPLKPDCLSTNDLSHRVTDLLDLPDELLQHICRYLSVPSVLYSFYTPDQPHARLHTATRDYSQKMVLDKLTMTEYDCIQQLLLHPKHPLRPQSLKLSNAYHVCLIERFFSDACSLDIQPLFDQLEDLALFHCSSSAFRIICANRVKFSQVVHFCLTSDNGNFQLSKRTPRRTARSTIHPSFRFSLHIRIPDITPRVSLQQIRVLLSHHRHSYLARSHSQKIVGTSSHH